VYLWVDGVYVKAGLEKDKAAMLVILAGLRDGRKLVLARSCLGETRRTRARAGQELSGS
jgi:hypothetical protein